MKGLARIPFVGEREASRQNVCFAPCWYRSIGIQSWGYRCMESPHRYEEIENQRDVISAGTHGNWY